MNTIPRPVGPSRAHRTDRATIAFLAGLSGLSAIAVDIVLPALGDIRAEFGLAPDSTRVSLLITTYMFGLGLGQVWFGPVADRFGRRPAIWAGIALYIAGALGSAFAPSLGVMIAMRFAMGFGAASPRAMSLTIARDRFEGDGMTRAVSLVMLFFQLSPAIAPLAGQGLLRLLPWQGIFVLLASIAALLAVWTTRVDETLTPERRLPLSLGRTLTTARAILGSRWALGHGLVLMFEFGAFYVYLSSSELVFDDVFGRKHLFPLLFALGAVSQAAVNFIASRVVAQVGSARLIARVIGLYVAAGAAFLAFTAASSGHPGFWPWLMLLWTLNALHALVLSTANSLAMQPLAAFAGTGSGLIGTMSMVGGAILASLVAGTIDGSATPMAAAYAVFGALAAGCLVFARTGSPALLQVHPPRPAEAGR